ncbi:MAG TPA: hypothetical protein PKL83_06625 [bacterium]|nr:hypothetical protein [bacterium]
MSYTSLFAEIDQLADEIIEQTDDLQANRLNIPAKKMFKLFLSLKNPFKERVLKRFTAGQSDPLAKSIRSLFTANRKSIPYFQSMISLSYFYWNWIQQFELGFTEEQYDELTLSLIYGATAYKLLDTYMDDQSGDTPSIPPQNLYIAKYLISCQESVLASHFRNPILYMQLTDKYNRLYCNFGMQELACRHTKSPVDLKNAIQLGHKSAPLLLYYALALDAAGKAKLIPVYEEMFFLTTTAIQLDDDIHDAVDDLLHGNITLATDDFIRTLPPGKKSLSPDKLPEAYAEYLMVSCRDLTLLRESQKSLEKALKISQNIKDSIFELFILSKLLGVLEKINHKEALYEKSERRQSEKAHRAKNR